MVWWRIGRSIMWSLMYYIAWVSNRCRNNNKKSLKIRLRNIDDDEIYGSPVCITVRPGFDWSLIAKVTFDSPDSSNPRILLNHASVASRIFQKIGNRSKTSTLWHIWQTQTMEVVKVDWQVSAKVDQRYWSRLLTLTSHIIFVNVEKLMIISN